MEQNGAVGQHAQAATHETLETLVWARPQEVIQEVLEAEVTELLAEVWNGAQSVNGIVVEHRQEDATTWNAFTHPLTELAPPSWGQHGWRLPGCQGDEQAPWSTKSDRITLPRRPVMQPRRQQSSRRPSPWNRVRPRQRVPCRRLQVSWPEPLLRANPPPTRP